MISPIGVFEPLKLGVINKLKRNNQVSSSASLFATRPDTFEKSSAQKKVDLPQTDILSLSFTGLKNAEPVRSLGHIICPCCGVEMMTQKDMNDVSRHLGQTAQQSIKTLNNYEKYMHPVEKECFENLKTWSEEQPELNFQQLLEAHKAPELEKLQKKQNTILDKVDELSSNLPQNEQELVKNVTKTTRELVSSTDKQIKFKRKTFIQNMEDLSEKISNKDLHKQMMKEAKTMPTSQNDVSAFVVKYADRKHNEIGERLVKLSVGTIEHIKPQSEGGRDDVRNYLLECGGCNHNRSSIPLGDWVDEHPEMIENTQKYMDKVIEFINNGGMKGFHFYPQAVANTLFMQSDGKLDIKVNGLKPEE